MNRVKCVGAFNIALVSTGLLWMKQRKSTQPLERQQAYLNL